MLSDDGLEVRVPAVLPSEMEYAAPSSLRKVSCDDYELCGEGSWG